MTFRFTALLCLLSLFLFQSCNKDEEEMPAPPKENPMATDINAYIRSLAYDPVEMLNVNNTPGDLAQKTPGASDTETGPLDRGYRTTCVRQSYELDRDFSEIAILNPGSGNIYPGALVLANADLLSGTPRPLGLERNPVTLTIDLPGIGEEGSFTVAEPSNATVSPAIDEALEHWNNTAFQQGYFNGARSYYEASEAFEQRQLGIELGINAEWVTGSVASHLSTSTSTDRRVALLAFRQIFYTITAQPPFEPTDYLGPDVTLEQVQSSTDANNHPAYVSAVDYGRIILFRMEATNVETSIDLNAVMNYAAGGVSVAADVASRYDEILSNSSISVLTIGGSAQSAAQALDNISGPGSLTPLIVENAVYSRENPGLPIAYRVNLLSDNRIVKLGFSSDYTDVRCGSIAYNHPRIDFYNDFDTYNLRIKLTYDHDYPPADDTGETTELQINDESSATLPDVPDGAFDVRMIVRRIDGFTWREWETRNLYHISSSQNEDCWRAYRGGFSTGFATFLEKCD